LALARSGGRWRRESKARADEHVTSGGGASGDVGAASNTVEPYVRKICLPDAL
jgi:hypothetical protein